MENYAGFKGVKQIKYPSEDMILRFGSKSRTGEIILQESSGKFKFKPELDITLNALYSPTMVMIDISPGEGTEILSATSTEAGVMSANDKTRLDKAAILDESNIFTKYNTFEDKVNLNNKNSNKDWLILSKQDTISEAPYSPPTLKLSYLNDFYQKEDLVYYTMYHNSATGDIEPAVTLNTYDNVIRILTASNMTGSKSIDFGIEAYNGDNIYSCALKDVISTRHSFHSIITFGEPDGNNEEPLLIIGNEYSGSARNTEIKFTDVGAGISGSIQLDSGAERFYIDYPANSLDSGFILTEADVSRFESILGNPTTSGYVLSSTTAGVRSWVAQGGAGASSFTDLSDTPIDYVGNAGRYVSVNTTENALEFTAAPGGTDLSVISPATTTVTIASSTGNDATINAATNTVAGVMTSADKSKLDGITTGAEPNAVDSVNTLTGAVVLDAASVGADPSGSAAVVQSNLDTHISAANPHAISTLTIGAPDISDQDELAGHMKLAVVAALPTSPAPDPDTIYFILA